MSQKTTTISCRVDAEDADFLLSLAFPGSTTLSDKMRHVLSEYRQHQRNLGNFRDCLVDFRRVIGPTCDEIYDLEHAHDLRSEFVKRLIESLPILMATLATSRRPERAEEEVAHLHRIEKRLLDQVFELIDTLLRIGLSPSPSCYDPDRFRKKLTDLLSLTDLMSQQIPQPKPE